MLTSGILGEDRIDRAEQKYAEKYVQEKTAELQARVEESFQMKKEELKRVETELKDLSGTLQKERKQQLEQLSQEIAAERERVNKEIAAERLELERQQNLLQQNLEKVTKELREAGDDVVNKFLTIAPLISSMGIGGQPNKDSRSLASGSEHCHLPSFSLPTFVSNPGKSSNGHLKEEEFFDRFRRVVEESNFTYGLLDLQRFHLSVKCSEITVLGGPSGTGKSSLPALYGQALLGDEGNGGRQGCLMVNISPSWMDIRDLLGHLNTLEGRFYPAESGLFQYLVYAQEEYKAQLSATGLYLACLDEMNLAQVEHYFSDFMMALDRGGAGRAIQCFAPEVASANCPFCKWGRIDLSPALRFVGTVNFDETTRLLSDRFLDRVNLINIKPKGLPGIAGANSLATAIGRMVTMSDYESWRTDSALPSDLGTLIDSMRPLLSQMGCPISPRVYRGICRFVSSSAPILPAAKAFDVQVAQRIIPKIRSLITRRQLDALDALLKVVNGSNICSFDESIPLLEEIRDFAGTRGWNLED